MSGVYAVLTDRDGGTIDVTGPYKLFEEAEKHADAWLAQQNTYSAGWFVGELKKITINGLVVHLPSD